MRELVVVKLAQFVLGSLLNCYLLKIRNNIQSASKGWMKWELLSKLLSQ